ncbi:MAG: DUF2782 domain-containing protein [Mariprofundaceae bacterium]|nr:DUF2782 domain-containing protein [Mariprofundaceae bacterium]
MKNIIRFTLLTSLSLSLLYASFATAQDVASPPPAHGTHHHAQNAADTVEEESPSNLNEALAPPKHDDGVDVRTYLRESDQARITEYSIRGQVYSIKVQPTGGFPAYYLEDSDGDGTLNKRLPGGYKPISPPMWVIKRF